MFRFIKITVCAFDLSGRHSEWMRRSKISFFSLRRVLTFEDFVARVPLRRPLNTVLEAAAHCGLRKTHEIDIRREITGYP